MRDVSAEFTVCTFRHTDPPNSLIHICEQHQIIPAVCRSFARISGLEFRKDIASSERNQHSVGTVWYVVEDKTMKEKCKYCIYYLCFEERTTAPIA